MASPTHFPVFVDSNLDTHLAIIVSGDDTVSDLKDKIEKEHQLCFPQLGKIKIHAAKVKRKGYYYHLSDSMFVQSAFHGLSTWFLCIDASSVNDHDQNHHSYNPDFGNILTSCGINDAALIERVELVSGVTPKRLPNLDDTKLVLDVNEQFTKAKSSSAHQNSSGNTGKELLESKKIEGEGSFDNMCKAPSPDANNIEDLGISIVCGPCSRESEVLNALSTHIEDNCGSKRNDAEYKESLDDKASSKAKRKRKKRTGELMNDHAALYHSVCENAVELSQQDVIVTKTSKIAACGEGSEEMRMGIKKIANEPYHSSSSDTFKRSRCTFQSTNANDRTEIPDEQVITKSKDLLFDNQFGVSQSSPASKKTKKVKKINRREQHIEANGVLVSESISDISLDGNKCSIKTAINSLSSDPLENVYQTGTSSISGKKKGKLKSSQISSPEKEIGGQSSSLTTRVEMKVIKEADVTDNLRAQSIQDITMSNLLRISETEMHYSNASGMQSPVDVDIRNSSIGNGRRTRDASENEAIIGMERLINTGDNKVANAKGETDQTDGVTEHIISLQISDKPLSFEKCISSGQNGTDMIMSEVTTSELVNTEKIDDSANTSKKKRRGKSKRHGTDMSAEAVKEDAKGSEHENSLMGPPKIVSCNISGKQTVVDERILSQNPSEEVGSARGNEEDNSYAGPLEPVKSNVSSKKTKADEVTFSQTSSEEVAIAFLALGRSGMKDTYRDLVETSQSNRTTMTEKKDGKMRQNSKKSTAYDKRSNEALAISSSDMEIRKGVDNHDQKGKARYEIARKTVTNNGKVNHLEKKKSLLEKSGSIFKEASSGSSQDEDVISNSDANVRTPSDHSFSSDHSDNESKENLNLAENGSNVLERKLLGGRNIRKTESTNAAKTIPLDRILRSSSRFKKAKITAAESQSEDTGCQAVDMVPDSQANI